MDFQTDQLSQRGFILGYTFSYLLFTTILYYLLFFSGKAKPLPSVIIFTASIALIGYAIKRYLQ